ncbi:MAG: ATP-binding protein, partial [Spirochaetes bacterium]|nr:ATP-binding protein [Spirochaetota bacterium]
KTPEDTLDPLYDEIRKRLVQFAEDHNLVYAYFWRLYDENTNQLQFIMSNDMNPETQIGPEVLFFESEEMTISALAGEVGANDLGDYIPEWYGLISGWAPVFDADGNLRAVAAVDVSDEYILALYRNVRNITVAQIALFFVTLISGIFNLLLYRRKTIEVVQANIRVSNEKMIVQTMQDNINQGIFIMDEELKILPNYSKPLIPILSYYDSELAGKNFLDILVGSLDTKQLQAMKGYFAMIFAKSKSAKILESVNPIYEFEYKVGDLTKILTTKFSLIEQKDAAPVVLAVIVDISKEREFEKEIQVQKDLQQQEVKNLFDVIQIDPAVFQDFIEDTESNFNYINSILKDKSLTEKQVITKFFQNVHAIKSNALILGLESFGKKLHILEEDIKAALAAKTINEDSVLSLAIKLETIMQEKDAYVKTIKKIESYKASHKLDSVFLYSLTKAVENISAETQKKVELKTVEMNLKILESNLRKPIKDILFQCLRNSIYHGIELPEERIKKNKKPAGLLTVSIKNVDNNAEVIFSDDGQGLDYEKIKNKYLMLNPDAKDTSNKVLLAAIFSPEFSTAGETTSVAGRGVGLSLVKDIVKKNKGTINVNSSESGVTFKFILPLAG